MKVSELIEKLWCDANGCWDDYFVLLKKYFDGKKITIINGALKGVSFYPLIQQREDGYACILLNPELAVYGENLSIDNCDMMIEVDL